MSKQINVFFLVPSTQLGGCTSFTVHLLLALKQAGFAPTLLKIGKAGMQPASFPYGIPAWSVSLEEAVQLAQTHPSMIAYCFWAKCGDYAKPLIHLGVPMVVHDPAEFHDDELTLMRERHYSPLVIRKANVAGLAAFGIKARYTPHPFVPHALPATVKIYHGLCLARVDFRKRTHTIIEANKVLEASRKDIHLYGEMNRIYEFHQLRKLHPDWRRWYHGEFPDKLGQAARMFARARIAVDLTHIKGDGGGTQYTFFEAWNAGTPLVLNRAWTTGPDDEVRDGDSCVMVDTAEELVTTMQRPLDAFGGVVEGGRRLVAAHSPEQVVPTYLEAMSA